MIKLGVEDRLAGGLRSATLMETVVRSGEADVASLCRPLIREPDLIRRWEDDLNHKPACISCNRCFEALLEGRPLRCVVDG